MVQCHWQNQPLTGLITLASDRVHLKPLASRKIRSVTQPDVQALVNAWSGTAAPRTVKRRYGVLAAVFAYAIAADWLARSPCRNIKLPSVASTRRRHLTPEHVAALAEAMDPRYRAMVWLGAVLGWRWEEQRDSGSPGSTCYAAPSPLPRQISETPRAGQLAGSPNLRRAEGPSHWPPPLEIY